MLLCASMKFRIQFIGDTIAVLWIRYYLWYTHFSWISWFVANREIKHSVNIYHHKYLLSLCWHPWIEINSQYHLSFWQGSFCAQFEEMLCSQLAFCRELGMLTSWSICSDNICFESNIFVMSVSLVLCFVFTIVIFEHC